MKIDVNVPCGISGEWEVKEFNVSIDNANMFNLRLKSHGREITPGIYKKLTRRDIVIMSNTPAEINDHEHFINIAQGNILITGLGLGVVLTALLNKSEIKTITIIEKSKDIIKLVAPTFLKDKRVRIINADALEWKPPKGTRYNFVWHDIWDNICSDNLEEMKKLHKKFGRYTKWQRSWCRDLCEYHKRRNTGY